MSGMGRVVWHDLMTRDLPASRDYYARLLGWEIREQPMDGGGTYDVIHAGGRPQGGLVALEGPLPPHWIAYVLVDDVDAACERAKAAGGSVAYGPADVPEGRFAVVRDGAGARFSPFRGARPPAPRGPGSFCWEELLTSDVPGARRFYEAVLGWGVRDLDLGELTYRVFTKGGEDVAGMMRLPPAAEAAPFWLPYVAVEDVSATTARVEQLGGRVLVEKEIPGAGRLAVTADPAGASIAFWKRQVA